MEQYLTYDALAVHVSAVCALEVGYVYYSVFEPAYLAVVSAGLAVVDGDVVIGVASHYYCFGCLRRAEIFLPWQGGVPDLYDIGYVESYLSADTFSVNESAIGAAAVGQGIAAVVELCYLTVTLAYRTVADYYVAFRASANGYRFHF